MSDPLPMLPGQHPNTVWQPSGKSRKPPFYRFNPRVRLSYVPLLVVLAAVVALVAVFFATRRPVALYLDGDLVPVQTHARTVRGLLAGRGIRLAEGDVVNPPLATRLRDDLVVSVRQVRDVRVVADGTVLVVRTRSIDPATILREANLSPGQHDAVLVERVDAPAPSDVARYPSLAREPVLPTQLRLVRARPVTVVDGESVLQLETVAPTVGEALLALDVPLHEGDSVQPDFGSPVTPNLQIVVERAQSVSVRQGDTAIETRTRAVSVGGLLDELGLTLSGEDYSLPSVDAPLVPGMEVRVVRVEESVLLEEEAISFEIVWRPEPSLELDQTVLQQAGHDGTLQREIAVRYEDGVEVSRTMRGEWVRQEPQDEMMGYGTQIVVRTLQTEFGSLDYWRRLRMLATSYTAATSGKEPGSPGYGITGTGLPAGYGIVAIDPRVVNWFTQLYVPDYGVGLAADAGGAIKNYRIDLGYDEDNLELWYRWVDVYLLTPVPAPEDIIWVLPQS